MDDRSGRSPFLQTVRDAIRVRHYSLPTEVAYVHWVKRFVLFHGKQQPALMAEHEVGAFLTYLAVERRVAPSTQNQALNALVFLYRNVLERPLGALPTVTRANRPVRIPMVLSCAEVGRLLAQLEGTHWLLACLLDGSGLRLGEGWGVASPGDHGHLVDRPPGVPSASETGAAHGSATLDGPGSLSLLPAVENGNSRRPDLSRRGCG